MAASTWLLVQYAECFVGGFLTSYLLCPRLKSRAGNETNGVYLESSKADILDDGETTVSVLQTEEAETQKDGSSCWLNQKQGVQEPTPEEGKNGKEKNAGEEGKKDNKTKMAVSTEGFRSNGTFHKIIVKQPKI